MSLRRAARPDFGRIEPPRSEGLSSVQIGAGFTSSEVDAPVAAPVLAVGQSGEPLRGPRASPEAQRASSRAYSSRSLEKENVARLSDAVELERQDNAPTWAHAVAGQVAGMVGLFVVHPIDTVKIRIQANGGAALATASSLVNRDGPLALYRGIGAPMVAYGLINAVAFSTNTAVSRYLGGGGARLLRERGDRPGGPGRVSAVGVNPWLLGLLGGGAAGLTSSVVRGPRSA